jgi:hypothetical protein
LVLRALGLRGDEGGMESAAAALVLAALVLAALVLAAVVLAAVVLAVGAAVVVLAVLAVLVIVEVAEGGGSAVLMRAGCRCGCRGA